MFKKLWKKYGPNPLEKTLLEVERKGGKTFLLIWNRGLGDIALGLYAVVYRIREVIPAAKITVITRSDLAFGFRLLEDIEVIERPEWERGKKYQVDASSYDCVLENIDPSHWVSWQRGLLVPKLSWKEEWGSLAQKFSLPASCVGVHVQCETSYYYERNWPIQNFEALFSEIEKPIVLFGLEKKPLFSHPHVYDLRGEMSLYEMLSIIKNNCKMLLAPDSGVLSLTYFLDTKFPIHVISLWADPNHGILKQGVLSPNPLLKHTPLISRNKKNASLISVEEVKTTILTSPLYG